MSGTVKIIIGADIAPTSLSQRYFETANMNELLGIELMEYLNNVDLRIFNLETPLTNIDAPIRKYGPNLRASEESINGIKALKPSFLTLANNHIMDHGISGMSSTIALLNNANIPFGGVGKNLDDASKPYIIEINNIKIGIYTCAEHEFSIANYNTPGANPFDVLESYDHVIDISNKCDYVIVLYHGGKEYYRYPSPNLQKCCRKFIEKGANLVVCQHSHCIGCEENYQNGKIIYGQGNFLFDKKNSNEYWDTGILINIEVQKENVIIKYVPVYHHSPGTRLAKGGIKRQILKGFYERSKNIIEPDFIKNNYQKFAESVSNMLFTRLDYLSTSFIFRAINKITNMKFLNWYFNYIVLPKKSLSIENLIECEAWQELLLICLKNIRK